MIVAVSLSDAGQGNWRVALYFHRAVDEATVRDQAAIAGAPAAAALRFERIAAKDWVAESLVGLKPVAAGRFIVHGAHDRAGIAPNRIGIEIEAALAFGTGHHGTTRGCLLALDRLCKSLRGGKAAPRILDLGTGSGVLAIAAARALRRRVLATDIDAAAVRVARANARLNRVGPLVTLATAAGVTAPAIRAQAPFDLVFANILLEPLQRLGRAARQDRRARRPRRAVRPSDRPSQCRARRLSRVPARTADRARRLDDAGAQARQISRPRRCPMSAVPLNCSACSRRISSRSRIAARAATACRGWRRCGRS